MATSSKPKSLDPRLARMATRGDDSAAARWMSGLAAATPAMPNGARVLVMLASEDSAGVLSPYQPARLHERLYTATVPLGRLDWLANHPDVLFVEAGRQLGEHLETSAPEIGVDKVWPPSPPGLGFDGKGVVVGIIDYGLDVCLADFADAQGTRVAFMWDQSLVPVGASEASPANFPYGVEYDKTAINAARAVGRLPNQHVRHEPRPGSHGTHVAGIAASNGSSTASHKGMAPAATIVFVQPAPTDTEGSLTDSVRVADAIAYVFQKARELRMPCVINMSLGQNGGSHDGESLVERAIDAMVAEQGRAFVCAAGNEHVWAGHAEGMLQLGMDVSLEWVMGGGLKIGPTQFAKGPDRTPNEMEIWYSSLDVVDVSVIDPAGNIVCTVAQDAEALVTLANGVEVFVEHERFARLNGDAYAYIEVSPPASGTIASGTWRVQLQPKQVRVGRYDAWIERDIRDRANDFADQSFFGGTSFVARSTLGTPATTRRGIAVANYDHKTTSVSSSSSRGTTRDGRGKPEVAAPGTDIESSGSMGRLNGPPLRVSMSGTSMAAPHVAGIVALMFERNAKLSAAQIRSILQAGVKAAVPAQQLPFDESWGHGRVDALQVLRLTPPP